MSVPVQPSASVVINTLNRAVHLEDALRALQGLDYPDFEVVVVNGPSTDDTDAVLKRWKDRIKVEYCPQANLSVSRNVGIAAASGEIVCFIDDDAAPHPKWLSNLARVFADPQVGGAGGFTIDNTGVRWQVRKTLCDRFGNAFNVSPLFDERPLNQPGVSYYPSLLGTNSSFRRSALREIGGFDPAFAYLLDETDVCLRLVDGGWKVLYEPTALIYHQFAPSHIRSAERIARTLYPSAVSKSYFIMRHGAAYSVSEASTALEHYRQEILSANQWLNEHGKIDEAHRFSLDQDLLRGIEDGQVLARSRQGEIGGGLKEPEPPREMKRFVRPDGLRIAFVTQGFPPASEAGIGRWTQMAAQGLADRGHHVHVITAASDNETVSFENGTWIHRLKPDPAAAPPFAETYAIPQSLAAWCARVWREAQHLKSFGLQLISFPIWDVEGLPLLEDATLPVVVSLHTTYKMAKPFKPEWSARPLLEHHHVNKIIEAEARVLAEAPMLLANSVAVLDAIEDLYGVDARPRSLLVPHGVSDPLKAREERAQLREAAVRNGAPLRVLFVGRFEPRKGFDIAAEVGARIAERGGRMEMWFVGDKPSGPLPAEAANLRVLGVLDRDALDDAYVDCDILLAPSRFESFGLIGVEAMAARRPAFVLAAGGLAEIIEDGVTGRCFVEGPYTVDDILKALDDLDADRAALLAMGERARRNYEERYTAEIMVTGLEEAYFKAAQSARTEPAYEH